MFSLRIWVFCAGLLVGMAGQVFAQPWQPHIRRMDWWRNTSTLDMDFANNRYMVSLTTPVTYTSLTQFITAVSGTFTRAGANETATGDPFYLAANQSFVSRGSTGTFFDSSGVMQTAATNTARADYNPATLAYQGILIEPARTNYVYNNTMVGAGVGTSTTLPTTWVRAAASNGGAPSYTIVGTGTEDGIPYIDIRMWDDGSPLSGGIGYNYTSTSITSASTWTASFYARLISGSLTNVSLQNGLAFTTASGTANIKSNLQPTPTGAPLSNQRYSLTYDVPDNLTSVATPRVRLSIDGGNYDFTIRIGAPQFELGSSPTSPILTGGATATRAADVYTAPSSGTYFDASGTLRNAPANTPRLDHDPSTTEPKGILIEEQRTNVAPSDITASPWLSYTPGGTVTLVSNSDVAPDGTTTAHRITCGGVGSCTRYMAPTVTSGTTYTFSFFTKAPSGGTICNRGRSGSATGGGVTYFSTNVGNGWIRHGFYETVTSSGTWLPIIINYSLNTPCTIWGPQIEVGAFPTSYIPTSGTAVTRAGDVFRIDDSGWINPLVGSIYVRGTIESPSSGSFWPGLFWMSDNGSTTNAAQQYLTSGGSRWIHQVLVGGTAYGINAPYTLGSELTSMISYEAGDLGGAANGTALAAGNPPSIPAFNRLELGRSRVHRATGYIKRFTYFPTRQPDYSLPDYTR